MAKALIILLLMQTVTLSEMSRFIRYSDNSGKNKLFTIKDDNVLVKYDEMQDKIKQLIDKILNSEPIFGGRM